MAGVASDVTWTETHSDDGNVTAVTLEGTIGAAGVQLAARLRPGPTGAFGYASLEGAVAGQSVDLEVHAADGGLGGGDAVKMEGVFAGLQVDLYADVSPNRRRSAVIRGTVDHSPVHVDSRRRPDPSHLTGISDLTGTYTGPTNLLAILIGAAVYF